MKRIRKNNLEINTGRLLLRSERLDDAEAIFNCRSNSKYLPTGLPAFGMTQNV